MPFGSEITLFEKKMETELYFRNICKTEGS